MFTKSYFSKSLVDTVNKCILSEADAKTQIKHKKEKIKLLKKQWKELEGVAKDTAKKYEVAKKKLDAEEASLEGLRTDVDKLYDVMSKASQDEKVVSREITELLGELEQLSPKDKEEAEEDSDVTEEEKDEEEEKAGEEKEEGEVVEEEEPEVEADKEEDEKIEEATQEQPASDFLIVDKKTGEKHLPVKKNGKVDHTLMGAAHAALTKGYRGNKYEGPNKGEALSKLKAMYAKEKLELPKE